MARSFLHNQGNNEDSQFRSVGIRLIRGLSVALILISTGTASWAQRPEVSLKTFTAPDGTFQFTYPDVLTQCKAQPEPSGDGYAWAQPECFAYIPLCNVGPGPDQSMACIAYPHNQYTNSPTFEGASLSVGETNENERDCLSSSGARATKEIMIRGVKFRVFESGDAALGHASRATSYATFHNGKCYGLGITIVTISAQAFDPPAKELTKRQWAEVNRRLEQVRDSFRFLK